MGIGFQAVEEGGQRSAAFQPFLRNLVGCWGPCLVEEEEGLLVQMQKGGGGMVGFPTPGIRGAGATLPC